MIRNILFDMGNVLIYFDRNLFMDRLGVSEEDKKLLMREVFLSVEWVCMDRGCGIGLFCPSPVCMS